MLEVAVDDGDDVARVLGQRPEPGLGAGHVLQGGPGQHGHELDELDLVLAEEVGHLAVGDVEAGHRPALAEDRGAQGRPQAGEHDAVGGIGRGRVGEHRPAARRRGPGGRGCGSTRRCSAAATLASTSWSTSRTRTRSTRSRVAAACRTAAKTASGDGAEAMWRPTSRSVENRSARDRVAGAAAGRAGRRACRRRGPAGQEGVDGGLGLRHRGRRRRGRPRGRCGPGPRRVRASS